MTHLKGFATSNLFNWLLLLSCLLSTAPFLSLKDDLGDDVRLPKHYILWKRTSQNFGLIPANISKNFFSSCSWVSIIIFIIRSAINNEVLWQYCVLAQKLQIYFCVVFHSSQLCSLKKRKLSNLLTSVETRQHIESQFPGTDSHIFM